MKIIERLFSNKRNRDEQYMSLLATVQGTDIDTARNILGEKNFNWSGSSCWWCDGYIKYKDIKAYFKVETDNNNQNRSYINIFQYE